jgi:hypothetical protein
MTATSIAYPFGHKKALRLPEGLLYEGEVTSGKLVFTKSVEFAVEGRPYNLAIVRTGDIAH